MKESAQSVLRVFICLLFLCSSMQVFSDSDTQINVSNKVSKSEAIEHGKAFADALQNRDYENLNKLFSYEGFAEKAAKTVFDSKKDLNDFVKGFMAAVKDGKDDFFKGMIGEAKGDIRAQFIRMHNDRPLVRLDFLNGGTTYFQLVLAKDSLGEITTDDMYLYSTTRLFSEEIGAFSSLLSKPTGSLIRKMFGIETVDKDLLENIQKVSAHKIAGETEKALELMDKLPKAIRESSIFLLQYIELTPIESPEYEKVVNRYIDIIGEEKVANLMLIDYYFLRGDSANALNAIQNLEKSIGGRDGFILLLKQNIFFQSGKYKSAIEYAERAIKGGDVFEETYWSLLNSHIALKEYAKAVNAIEQLEAIYGQSFSIEDFTSNPELEEFASSDEFLDYFASKE